MGKLDKTYRVIFYLYEDLINESEGLFLVCMILLFNTKCQGLITKVYVFNVLFAIMLICQCQAVLSVEGTKLLNINKGMSSFVFHFC